MTTRETEVEIETRERLVDLVKLDYEATCSLIDGLVRTSLGLRAAALTLIVALLGFAVERLSWAVALCALGATALFFYLDAFHGWLYAQARQRAREMEHLLSLRYKELERRDDPDVTFDLDVALATHRFGQYSSFRSFKFRSLSKASPRKIYAVLYGALAVSSAAAAAYAWLA